MIYYFLGSSLSILASTISFQYIFRRRFAATIIFCNAVTIIISIIYISLNQMIPEFNQNDYLPVNFVYFAFGIIAGSVYLFMQLIGPLLVAAHYRKNYEVQMGGTMIGCCYGLSLIFGTGIGYLFYEIGKQADSNQFQRTLIAFVFFCSSLPFIVPCINEYNKLKSTTIGKPVVEEITQF